MDIRLADLDDLTRVKELYRILFKAMEDLQAYYLKDADQDEEFIRRIIEGENSDILLVEENGFVCGFLLIEIQDTPNYNCIVSHRFAYIMDLVVDPNFRGEGKARALIESAKTWARDRKADYLELNVLKENEKAINLYENVGFQETNKYMRHVLDK